MRLVKEKKIVDETAKVDIFSALIASCFFVGYIPKASGTFGSMFALLFFLINGFGKPEVLLAAVIISFILGIYTSRVLMKKYGDDPSVIVIDEVSGMWTSVLIYIILSGNNPDLFYFILLFFAFRFFDIVKVQPAKYFDRLHTALGVMTDDIVAGIYAGISVYLFSFTHFTITLP